MLAVIINLVNASIYVPRMILMWVCSRWLHKFNKRSCNYSFSLPGNNLHCQNLKLQFEQHHSSIRRCWNYKRFFMPSIMADSSSNGTFFSLFSREFPLFAHNIRLSLRFHHTSAKNVLVLLQNNWQYARLINIFLFRET